MKKLFKIVLMFAIIMFTSISMFNYSFAENTTVDSEETQTYVTTDPSSTTVGGDDFFSNPANWINVLLIAVGVVIILLAIAILTKMGKNK